MRAYTTAAAIASVAFFTSSPAAFSIECDSAHRGTIGVEIFGDQQDLYQIMEYDYLKVNNDPRKITNRKIIYNAEVESRASFGGNAKKKPLQCGNVRYLGNSIAVAVGWKADLLHLYHVEFNNNKAYKVHPLHFYARDHAIYASIDADNSIRVVYGRKRDVNFRFCFRDGGWWQAAGPVRKGRAPMPCTIPSGHARPVVQL
ncbi:MAG: hypothetical protein ACK40W_02570 [Allorhizobium sp.]